MPTATQSSKTKKLSGSERAATDRMNLKRQGLLASAHSRYSRKPIKWFASDAEMFEPDERGVCRIEFTAAFEYTKTNGDVAEAGGTVAVSLDLNTGLIDFEDWNDS